MIHIKTTRRWIRPESAFDWRWLLAFGIGLVFSIAYYVALIWAGVWALGWLVDMVTRR